MSDLRPENDGGGARGTSILLLLVMLLLIGGFSYWALHETPPATPNPSATALPDKMPRS